jgi:UDP-N-acetylglucosamine 4,6-dehydratase/5-epimerase
MSIRQTIKGRTILITGGTGSFGNTVVNKLLELAPKKIIVFSRDEKKQFDMRNNYDNPVLKFVIGDIRELESIKNAMRGVDYVFHAAALKQVPSCEFFPIEAVKTNIIGTQNVLTASNYHKVKRVVALSTDKAVYPINALGLTKSLMEKLVIAESRNIDTSSETIFCNVRYGNVLYTRGSVLPYFVKFIKENKKLMITENNMTRFLLPLEEAVDLVFYALLNGENGHTYVRKSPACTVETLAKALCEIFNYQNGFKSVGIRAGEKIHETLVNEEELLRAVDMGRYYKIPPESQGLDYNQYFVRGKKEDIETMKSFTSENTKRLNVKETKALLLQVPEIVTELNEYRKNT